MTILSFGEIIWDVYPDKQTLGGAPLNLAAHAALQGCDAWIISAVGEDELGAKAIKQIANLGVTVKCVDMQTEYETGKCVVSLDQNGAPTYNVLKNVAWDHIPISTELPPECDVLAFGTLSLREKHNKETLELLLSKINSAEIYADLNIRPPFYSADSIIFCLSNATIVKISDEELSIVMGAISDEKFDCESAAVLLAERFPNIKLILLTKGENGSLCYETKGKRFIFAPAEPTKAVSTVGAGDSFGATFLAHYMKSGDISASLALASKVSAFVVSRQGAIPEDIKDFLDQIELI